MPILKIQAGRVITQTINTFIGTEGTIFYDEHTGEMRLSDGHTPGGIPLSSGSGGTGNGYTGSKGEQGAPGTSVKITGSTSTYFDLSPSYTGDIGDGYILTSTGHLAVWLGTETSWVDVGTIIGYTGSQGYTGYTGSTGTQGDIGYTGSIGFTGSQGTTGFVGSTGYWGSVGYSGSQGYTGSYGIDGYTGSRGDIGYVGSQGIEGYTGSRGYTGSAGIDGYTGSRGIEGYTGSQGDFGYTGSIGFTGSQGIEGYVGSQGVGYTGSRGTDGTSVTILGTYYDLTALSTAHPTGSLGDGYILSSNGHLATWTGSAWADVGNITGPQGETGFVGSIGYTGSLGYTGSAGIDGYTGSRGIDGYTGSRGDLGYTGSIGYTGSAGIDGYTGSRGIEGYVGSRGDLGYTGSIGYTGSYGIDGYVGSQGYTGSQGQKGSTGTSVRILGSVSSSTDLSLSYTGDIGDGYIVTANGHLDIWTGATWSDVGQIVGYTGSAGTGTGGGSIIGLTSNGTDTVTLSSGFKFIPETDKLQDLGSPTHRFGKIYLAGQTIDLGGTIISQGTDGDLQIKKPNGELEQVTAKTLKLGSTGTDGVVLSFTSGTFSIVSSGTNINNLLSTGTITATNIVVTGSNISTSTSSGALIVKGGVGIGGALYANTTSFVAGAEILTTGTIDLYAVTLNGTQTLRNKTIIVPSGGALYFDDDIALAAAHGASSSYKQTSAAPKMFTNASFGIIGGVPTFGTYWADSGGPDLGYNTVGTVATSADLPAGYTGMVYDAYTVLDSGNSWLWLAPSTTDMKPGDYYYDDVNQTLYICYEYTDPSTGLPAYNNLDITPR